MRVSWCRPLKGFETDPIGISPLDNHKTFERVDKGNMRMMISSFPSLVRKAMEISEGHILPENCRGMREMVVCGMGGSAIGGDLFKDLCQATVPIKVSVIREYDLPKHIDKKSLVVVVSYSGNTEEALESFKQAYTVGASIVAVASNGLLELACNRLGVPFIKIPSGLQPRAALPLLFIPLLKIAEELGFPIVDWNAMDRARALLEDYNKELSFESPVNRNPAKQLALRIYGKLPVVYSLGHLKSVALRYKDQINENAKLRAMCDAFPEMNHNEIEAWERADFKEFLHVILIDSKFKNPYVAESVRQLVSKVKDVGVDISIVNPLGETMIEEMLSAIILGDWVSYYLAILRGVDPASVSLITELKKRREENSKYFKVFEEWLNKVCG
ncbi:MAG: bifunctional phosphoglucose/phosphomannose isomerase, partial [Thermoproteota archaeon]